MPTFSNVSLSKLSSCHPDIQTLMYHVVKFFDCQVLEGHRTLEQQRLNVINGKSKTMNSRHLSTPSLAIDVAPYPIDWEDRERFHYFAGYVMAIAAILGIKLRWGGDWDNDTEVKDNSFDDLVHFELME